MVVATAIGAAIAAVVMSQGIFPHLSVNNDEAVYLLQAKAMAAGHLFPQVGHPASSFVPWLGTIHGGHYVLKYTPVTAAVFALSWLLTSSYLPALALVAAAFVVATFGLATELTGERRTGALAAILIAASPLVLVQNALILPYVQFLVLVEVALWALLKGVRPPHFRFFFLAGVMSGLALADRTYDALLLLGPFAVWMLWRCNDRRRAALGLFGGSAVPVAGLLWFNAAATGSALRLPFSLFERADTVGFGIRRIYPGEAARHFGLSEAWKGLGRHLVLLGDGWALGGLLLVLLAAFGFVRSPRKTNYTPLLTSTAVFIVGYFCFWGLWNSAILWGGVSYLGPYYLLPLLIPLCVLAAVGLNRLASQSAILVTAAGLIMVVSSSIVLGRAIIDNARLGVQNKQLSAAVAAQDKSLIFVDTYPAYLQHPTSVIVNSAGLHGRTVYALDRGRADFTVIANYPGRRLLRLRLLGEYGKHADRGYGAQLEQLHRFSGRYLLLNVRGHRHDIRGARLRAAVGGTTHTWPLTGAATEICITAAADPSGCGGHAVILRADPGKVDDAIFDVLGSTGTTTRPDGHLRIALAANAATGELTALVATGVLRDLGPLSPAPLTVTLAPQAG